MDDSSVTVTIEDMEKIRHAMDAAAVSALPTPTPSVTWHGVDQEVIQEVAMIMRVAKLDNRRMLGVLKNLRSKYEDSLSGD